MHPGCSNCHMDSFTFSSDRQHRHFVLFDKAIWTKNFRLFRASSMELTFTVSSWPVAITDSVLRATEIHHVFQSTMRMRTLISPPWQPRFLYGRLREYKFSIRRYINTKNYRFITAVHIAHSSYYIHDPLIDVTERIIMVALCNRADHYIFALWFLSSSSFFFFFFPRLISAAVDWMSTILPHMVWP